MKKKAIKIEIFNIKGKMDLSIFFTVLFFIAFGIVMVYSSSFNIQFDVEGKVRPLIQQVWFRQMIFGVAGLLIMLLGSFISTKLACLFGLILYVPIILLLAFIEQLGEGSRGAVRAIDIGFFAFQPSEFAKLIVILVLAFFIDLGQRHLRKPVFLGYMLLLGTIPLVFVAFQDFSSSAVILAIIAGIVFVSYQRLDHLFMGGAASLFAMYILYKVRKIGETRLELHAAGPWADAEGKGRQAVQSLLAIGSGGFFGRGLGNSLQKMGRVTQAHHDIIFPIICEELGLFGASMIILLYLVLLYMLLQVAAGAGSLRDSLIVIGIMTQIAAQVFINIGVATNFLPNTGMPLPFISYGGSSLLVLSLEIALVLSVSRSNQYAQMMKYEQYEEKILDEK